jgi:hypothetical protein
MYFPGLRAYLNIFINLRTKDNLDKVINKHIWHKVSSQVFSDKMGTRLFIKTHKSS